MWYWDIKVSKTYHLHGIKVVHFWMYLNSFDHVLSYEKFISTFYLFHRIISLLCDYFWTLPEPLSTYSMIKRKFQKILYKKYIVIPIHFIDISLHISYQIICNFLKRTSHECGYYKVLYYCHIHKTHCAYKCTGARRLSNRILQFSTIH